MQQQHNEIGQLEEHEIQQISSLRKAASDMVQQIGQLEVQKARMLGQMAEMEERAQKILNDAKGRFGIAPHQPCFVTVDGKVVTNEPVGPMSVPTDDSQPAT